jgi:hypothetical protein
MKQNLIELKGVDPQLQSGISILLSQFLTDQEE